MTLCTFLSSTLVSEIIPHDFLNSKYSCIMSVTCNKWYCKKRRQSHSPCIHAEITEFYFCGWRKKMRERMNRPWLSVTLMLTRGVHSGYFYCLDFTAQLITSCLVYSKPWKSYRWYDRNTLSSLHSFSFFVFVSRLLVDKTHTFEVMVSMKS